MERLRRRVCGFLVIMNIAVLFVIGIMAVDLFKRVLTAVPASVAAGIQFRLGAETVEVYLDGAGLQSIPFERDALTDANRDFFVQTPDINFDGIQDVLLIASEGLQNIYYDGWVWDDAARRFVLLPEIRALSSPVFDEKERVINTYHHVSATDHEAGVYKYMEGSLIQEEKIVQRMNAETGLIDVERYARNAAGEMALIEKSSFEPDQ